MRKPRTFQKLARKVHDMEMTIANSCGEASSTSEARKDKGDFKKSFKYSKSLTKEPMSISTDEQIQILGKLRLD